MLGSVAHLVAGVVLGSGVTAIAVTAAADDSYFDDQISHWEVLTTRAGPGAVAVFLVGAAVAAALALACVVRGLLPRRRAFTLPLLVVVPLYTVSVLLAWATLVGGH